MAKSHNNMKEKTNKLVNSVKDQAQIFLLDAGEFYPFGCCIDKMNQLKPIGVYLENDNPSSSELISLLQKSIRAGVENGLYEIAVVAIDVNINENNIDHDAIELRFFEVSGEYKNYIKYLPHGTHVEFI